MTIRSLVKGVNPDTNTAEKLSSKECSFAIGPEVEALVVAPVYYNPTSMKYEWATLPSIHVDDLTVTMGDVEKLLAETYWGRTKYDWLSDQLNYVGCNTDASASEGDADWWVFKYVWSGTSLTEIQVRQGSWSGRAGLGWV